MIDLTAMFAIFVVFGMPVVALATVLHHLRARNQLKVRELEAQARLLEAQTALPAWVDPRDPASLSAWRAARAELDAPRRLGG